MIAWGAADAAAQWPKTRMIVAGAGVAVCAGCLALTWWQVVHWRNSESLFRHAIAVTDGNYLAYGSLGLALKEQGRWVEATSTYAQAVQIRPQFPEAQNNLGQALLAQGHPREALTHIKRGPATRAWVNRRPHQSRRGAEPSRKDR